MSDKETREIRKNELKAPQVTPTKPTITLEVYQHDWLPGFAAFHSDGERTEGATKHIVLNLGSLLCAVESGDLPKQDLPYMIAESLMHETVHALEEWAGVEFSEDRVEELLTTYRAKYARATIWEYTGSEPKEPAIEGTSEQSAPELELEQEADGRWLAAYTRFPGVAAYGPLKEEAIWNAAKVLIESEPAPPTPELCLGCGQECDIHKGTLTSVHGWYHESCAPKLFDSSPGTTKGTTKD